MTSARSETIGELLERLLDRGYTQAVRGVIEAFSRLSNTGALRLRLDQLEARGRELEERGTRWQPDDPVLRALFAELDAALRGQAALLTTGASKAVEQGAEAAATAVRQLTLGGLNDDALLRIGVQWNTPDPEAVREIVDITLRPAWSAEVDRFRTGAADAIRSIVIRGVVNGENPLQLALDIQQAVQEIPLYRANTLMRTAQLHAYRVATAAHHQANAELAQTVIRIGTLDNRICLCCLALHGTSMRPGEVVLDHHNGRCTSIMVLRGRPVTVSTGEQWLRAQSEARQRELMGTSAFEAWTEGRVRLRDFIQSYSDPVFGDMVRQASLSELLG